MNYDAKMKNRLKRMEGQVRGLLNMMEEEKDCREVVTQMSAVRTALDRAMATVVSENLQQCLANDEDHREEAVQEAVRLLVRSR
ncbi:hypothetical protein N781_09380 [Pontibacillus halophilus JSM 076056 = DSM 19796]|uniref:Cytoplasmic protein n=1 Tax=Pontibacillus halophilus JSM 076056 = DSM 19796 TaxID=1385510 RepID=A0A0A5GDK8_9BACI|nr:metal-sensitive transcriptional regulator [Pontibacillus halophilus]KGX89298.1 hypothetical protein N781_09380 [Pontibacillus halophilus JSM 076056 = DSM 19796]